MCVFDCAARYSGTELIMPISAKKLSAEVFGFSNSKMDERPRELSVGLSRIALILIANPLEVENTDVALSVVALYRYRVRSIPIETVQGHKDP